MILVLKESDVNAHINGEDYDPLEVTTSSFRVTRRAVEQADIIVFKYRDDSVTKYRELKNRFGEKSIYSANHPEL